MTPRERQLAYNEFNQGVWRARREYQAFPIASCALWLCDGLADAGGTLCSHHLRIYNAAVSGSVAAYRAARRSV